MEQEKLRLINLAEQVLQQKYPCLFTKKPTHFKGIAYTLVLELLSYDIDSMSDEHIKDLMNIDLGELKKSLN